MAFKPVIRAPRTEPAPAHASGQQVHRADRGRRDTKPLNGACMTSAGAAARSVCDNCNFIDEKMAFLREETMKRGLRHRRRRPHGPL